MKKDAGRLARPAVEAVDVWTSAGIAAGIDLALALIEQDHGFAAARGVAALVVGHRRHGGQSQFARSAPRPARRRPAPSSASGPTWPGAVGFGDGERIRRAFLRVFGRHAA